MNKLTLSSLVVLLVGCQRYIPPEAACGFIETANSQRVTWGLDTPIDMYIDSSVPTSYIPVIQDAANVWNEASEQYIGRDLFRIHPYSSGVSTPGSTSYNTIYYIPRWPSNEPATEEAVTYFSYIGDVMVGAYIKIDGDYSWSTDDDWSNCPTSITNYCVSLKSVMIHELGHVMGLAHTPTDPLSVMYPSLGSNATRTVLQPENIYSIQCGY